jgi:hypothetical protein
MKIILQESRRGISTRNLRLRWTFAPLGDLYIVYKHNIQQSIPERWWQYDASQLTIKLSYGLAM